MSFTKKVPMGKVWDGVACEYAITLASPFK